MEIGSNLKRREKERKEGGDVREVEFVDYSRLGVQQSNNIASVSSPVQLTRD